MGGPDSATDKSSNNDLEKNFSELNSTNGDSGPLQQSSQNIALTPSTQKTTTSSTTDTTKATSPSTIPNSSAITSPSEQGIIASTQWSVLEWFGLSGNCENWLNFVVKWIILALEEKENSEQIHIKRGLEVIERETEEIYKAGIIDSDSYKFCSDLIMRCGSFRSSYDADKRNDLLNIIFGHLQFEFEKAKSLIGIIAGLSVEQRVVLRFMVHQNIQARIAFLRTTLKTQKTTNDMERYHCVTNPYYAEVVKQKDNAIAERDMALVERDNAITERNNLQEAITVVKNSNSDLNARYNELLAKNKELTQENFELKGQLEDEDINEKIKLNQENMELIEKNEELDQQNIKLEEQLNQLSSQKEQDQKALVRELMDNYANLKLEHEEDIKQLQEEAEELRKEVKSAKEEASTYQAALGSATNIRWSDSTFNNPIQLTKDIEKFQHLLTDFTKVKGKFIKINETNAKQLLASYHCKADVDTKEVKNYLAAALQRMILEIIFSSADSCKFGKFSNYDDNLESCIVYYNKNLVKCTNSLASQREGQDSITAIAPIKIRQQVFAALGSRGFAKSGHPFIKKLTDEILGKMEKYREVLDEVRKNVLPSEAEKIIRTGIQLCFCLKAQEPVPKIRWFKSGARLETHLMVGSWENEDIKEIEVDFAFFPLIINEHDNQVFNKAQVLVRPKQNGKLQKFKNMFYSR